MHFINEENGAQSVTFKPLAGGDAMRDLAQTLAAAHSCALTALEASEMRVAEFEAGRGAKLAASCRRVLDGGGSEETAPT